MQDHLKSECGRVPCRQCQEPVKQSVNGGWYITLGHAGFNSPKNNRGGYKTKELAVAAFKRFGGK